MKSLIKKLLRESINLNLSKQIRNLQKNRDVTPILDEIFGKNIYRLYYDLNTGKQITPTKKKPKLKFDVQTSNRLKNDIEMILNKLGYSIVDIEKNIAKNVKTNQQIKISKIITNTDNIIAKQYNEYLDSLTKKYNENEKLYVVISRHSHDIASMSSKPKITSCENLSDYADIKDTHMGTDFGEGQGAGIWEAIKGGKLVFYLIREDDLNIQDPISRYLEGKVCEFGNSYNFYGKFHEGFKEFLNDWISYYNNIKGVYNTRSDKNLYSKSLEDINKILFSINDNKTEYENALRGIVRHERYDVIYDMMCKSEYKDIDNRYKEFRVFDQEKVPRVTDKLTSLFGYKIFNILPAKIKDPIFKKINGDMNHKLTQAKSLYEILYFDFDKTELVKKLKERPEILKYLNKEDFIRQWMYYNNETVPYGDLAKLVNIDVYNQINQYNIKNKKIPDFHNKIKEYYDKVFR